MSDASESDKAFPAVCHDPVRLWQAKAVGKAVAGGQAGAAGVVVLNGTFLMPATLKLGASHSGTPTRKPHAVRPDPVLTTAELPFRVYPK